MAQQRQVSKPTTLNVDKSRKYLTESESFFMLNSDALAVAGKTCPLPANSPLCEVEQPEGENFTTGTYYSPLTNESYAWIFNDGGNNYLQRVNPDGTCQIVYSGECLHLSANPSNRIFDWRAKMRLEKICHNRHGKQLIWVDGTDNDIACVDVEASIATDNFTTPFFDRCADPCAPLRLCVPEICGCVQGEFVTLEEGQEVLTNHLIDVGVKIIVRHVYYDLRASEWSIPSTLFYQDIKGGCFGGNEGFSRCLKLTIPLGNPLVDKIEIGYSVDNGATWLLSDTVEKYDSYTSSLQYWYERDINPDLDLTEDGCSFYYTFCNDKQCQVIDPKEIRAFNPMPREVQGLIGINESLALYNYKQGNCPLDKVETDKFTVDLSCDNTADCVTEFVTVKVRAIIHNTLDNTNEFVYREGGAYSRYGSGDDLTEPAYFGGFERILPLNYYKTFDQEFAGTKRNFEVYVEGTNYSAKMSQYRAYDGFTQNKYVDIISGFLQAGTRQDVTSIINTGFYYYQEAEIKLPKGMKGFLRLDSHRSSSLNHDTSTFVLGTIEDIHDYHSQSVLPTVTREFEVYFDTCSGSVELDKTFIIQDNAEESNSKAANGLVIDSSGAPIAGVDVFTADDFYLGRTDHNGFYHFTLSSVGDSVSVKVVMELDCDDFGSVQTETIDLEAGKNVIKDIKVSSTDYAQGFYAWAQVHVVDCDGNNAPGIPVAVSGAKFRYTDDSGTALVPIRNYPNRARQVRAIAMDTGGCFLLDCDGDCNPCSSAEVLTAPACFDVVHFIPESIVFADIVLNTNQKSLNNRGLKKGGRYGWGIVAMGDCGRISSVYPLANEYIDIPRFQTNSSEDFCSYSYNAHEINLPSWVKCLQVVRTANLNPFELQWLVDKIERTGDGKIKLTIQSLNDYNEDADFKTNTVYQYQQGDRVEFISNGDGSVFTTAGEGGILNYATLNPLNDGTTDNTDANFFNQLVIQDDGKLNALQKGAKIEIQRAKNCTTEPVYFSICVSLPVVDGQVVDQTGTFETFDTFRVNRTIGEFSPQSFEHFAPSDYWTTAMSDIGKSYFKNQYENERRYGRNYSLNSPTQFNRFGDTVKTVSAPEQGDIIASWISDARAVLGICENDSFVLTVADDLVRVGADSSIIAVPANRIIGDPQIQLGAQLGCRYQDAASILFDEGFALWADVRRDAYCKHNYSNAKDVSEGKFKTYLKQKFRLYQLGNTLASDDLDKLAFSTGVNRSNGVVHLTIKSLHLPDINNEDKALSLLNETFLFYPQTDDFLTFASFTPEAYSTINLPDAEGCAFISYSKGIPYHHPIIPTAWNRFYGVDVDRILGFVINKFPEKIKVAISLEIQDETMWYVSSVTSDRAGYLSEIPASRFRKTEDKWSASFLGNKNGRKGLFSSEQPRGYEISVTLKRDNLNANVISSISSEKRIKFDMLDNITTKIFFSEQSGFTENL